LLLRRDRGFAIHFIEQFQQAQTLDAHPQSVIGDIGETHVFVDEPCAFVQGAVVYRY